MQPIQRLELVIDAIHVELVIDVLRRVGVTGYTVVNGASGWGDRGARRPDGVSGVFENCVVLCACDQAQLDNAIEQLKPILQRYGGVGLVSDAQWITH
jgi:hypothetical protein